MNRSGWGLGVVVVSLILGGGCETLQRLDLSLASSTAGRERVVTGSVQSVARSTQIVLEEMGMQATLHPDGEVVRVRAATSRGQKFDVVLARTTEGRTRIRLEWDGVADDGVGYQLLAGLDAVFNR